MLKTVIENKDPKILVITPLKTGHKISRETRTSVKRNEIPLTWISYEAKNNPAKNTQLAMDEYELEHELPPYIIKMDNDIDANRGMLDKMYMALSEDSFNSTRKCGYAYCGFKFTGVINHSFPLQQFDPNRLMKQNYISFNSLIDTKALKHIGGFVTSDKYARLLDWALWLKFLYYGYQGLPVDETSFIAYASPDSVSAGSSEEYRKKAKAIQQDYLFPLKVKHHRG